MKERFQEKKKERRSRPRKKDSRKMTKKKEGRNWKMQVRIKHLATF